MNRINIMPPVYLLFAMVIMVVLHSLLPGMKVLALPWSLLGIVPLALGCVVNLVVDSSFKKHETTVKPLEESTALITTGIFRFSLHGCRFH